MHWNSPFTKNEESAPTKPIRESNRGTFLEAYLSYATATAPVTSHHMIYPTV
jgi:hypothetical protein